MPWARVNIDVIQSASTVYSGHVFKMYEPGTVTAISVATDKDGTDTYATLTTNSAGVFEVSGNEVLPYIDRDHKWALFANADDAANNTNPVLGFFDNIPYASAANLDYTSSSTIGQRLDNLDVADYPELRALTVTQLEDGQTVTITNMYISGEGQIRKVTGHGLTDNGGTIIVLDANTYWERSIDGISNGKWFGIQGDGTTDDKTSFDLVEAATSEYFLPAGTYRISSDITLAGTINLETGAIISPDSGVTVTINGEVVTEEGQHFGGDGDIVFRDSSKIKLSWFSTGGTGTIIDKWTGWENKLNAQLSNDNSISIEVDGYFIQTISILQGNTQGVVVWGSTWQASSIQVNTAIIGWDISRTVPNETGTIFYNFQYRGDDVNALNIIYISDGNYTIIENMHIRSSTTSALVLDNDSNGTRIHKCVFDANAVYDILLSTDTVATSITDCDCNKNLASTGAMIGCDTVGSLTVDTINYNGFSNAPFLEVFGSSGNSLMTFKNVYAECGSAKGVEIIDTAVVERITFDTCNIQSSNNVTYDFNNGQTHGQIRIVNVQNSQCTAGRRLVDRTGVTSYEIKNVNLAGGTTDGASGVVARTVREPGHLLRGGTYSYDLRTFADGDTTPDIELANVFITNNTLATSITDFDSPSDQQIIYISFSDGNTTIVHGAGVIELAGSANFVGSVGDTLTLLSINGVWQEVSRKVA